MEQNYFYGRRRGGFLLKKCSYMQNAYSILQKVFQNGAFFDNFGTPISLDQQIVFLHLSESPRNFALYFCYTAYRKQTKKQMNSFRLQAKTKQLYI